MLVSCNIVPQTKTISTHTKTAPISMLCLTIEANAVIHHLSIPLNSTVVKMVANMELGFFKSRMVLHKIRKATFKRHGCYLILVPQIALEIPMN